MLLLTLMTMMMIVTPPPPPPPPSSSSSFICSLVTSSRCNNEAYEQDKDAERALTFAPKNSKNYRSASFTVRTKLSRALKSTLSGKLFQILTGVKACCFWYIVAVYVMLAMQHEFEGMMIAMQHRRLLDGGEYFLVGVDSKPYDPSHPQVYIEGCVTRCWMCRVV